MRGTKRPNESGLPSKRWLQAVCGCHSKGGATCSQNRHPGAGLLGKEQTATKVNATEAWGRDAGRGRNPRVVGGEGTKEGQRGLLVRIQAQGAQIFGLQPCAVLSQACCQAEHHANSTHTQPRRAQQVQQRQEGATKPAATAAAACWLKSWLLPGLCCCRLCLLEPWHVNWHRCLVWQVPAAVGAVIVVNAAACAAGLLQGCKVLDAAEWRQRGSAAGTPRCGRRAGAVAATDAAHAGRASGPWGG